MTLGWTQAIPSHAVVAAPSRRVTGFSVDIRYGRNLRTLTGTIPKLTGPRPV